MGGGEEGSLWGGRRTGGRRWIRWNGVDNGGGGIMIEIIGLLIRRTRRGKKDFGGGEGGGQRSDRGDSRGGRNLVSDVLDAVLRGAGPALGKNQRMSSQF